jgi:hypothetical protein
MTSAPDGDRRRHAFGSPLVMRNASLRTGMFSANALPEAVWQFVQLQVYRKRGKDAISYRIAPQEQPPIIGSVGLLAVMISPDRNNGRC